MAGAAIQALNVAISSMVQELRKMPQALETVAISVIAFSGEARLAVPLTSLELFKLPTLKIHPGTSLGRALDMFAACVETDIVMTTEKRKGDWLPLVFLFTDGQPTDDWRGAAERIKKLAMPKVVQARADEPNHSKTRAPERTASPKIACIYAIGCGDDVDFSVLHEITNNVYKTSEMDAEAIRDAFVWITASVRHASTGIAGSALCLPEPPADCGLKEVPKGDGVLSEHDPRQVFIHAKCSKTRGDYLMRFARESGADAYAATAVHKLDACGAGFGAALPPIQASRLLGMVACAYCSNESVAICVCGGAMCLNLNHSDGVICPHCGTEQQGDFITGDFSIRQSAG
jgi:uncharacterized protein YegL